MATELTLLAVLPPPSATEPHPLATEWLPNATEALSPVAAPPPKAMDSGPVAYDP